MQVFQCLCVVLLFFTAQSAAANYDYKQALGYSLLFYEAQRSGKLPSDQHVTWRHDSALNDKGDNGEDLTGGYYDAGDFVKFGLPMAYTVTVLAWGAIEYPQGFDSAGQTNAIQEAIRWGTDYFLKCHVNDDTFYGQVGNGEADHAWWGRPEDMPMDRPAYKITTQNPGSELAGQTAAALAAASIVFKNTDSGYANTLLQHAQSLFNLANDHRLTYVRSITDAVSFYNSYSGFNDEITWAAAWIAKATGDQAWIGRARDLYNEFGFEQDTGSNLSWDDVTAGIEVIMFELTGDQRHMTRLNQYTNDVMHVKPHTPKGLVFIDAWGSLRHAANAAFITIRAAELGGRQQDLIQFAQTQLGYILGDTGRSFLIGFGQNYPTHPHHRSSSCPDAPATCDWQNYNSNDPNPQILYGAVVGGPDQNDNYQDVRTDYAVNEVATDYNAAFTGLLAAFIQNNY